MTALKYSRQRESIKDYLMHTNAHPTADMVYLHVKEQFPNISLGTVYRNLNLLSDMGEIIKIPTRKGGVLKDVLPDAILLHRVWMHERYEYGMYKANQPDRQ